MVYYPSYVEPKKRDLFKEEYFPFLEKTPYWILDRNEIKELNKKKLSDLRLKLKELNDKKEIAKSKNQWKSFEFIIKMIIRLEKEIEIEIQRQEPLQVRW